MVLPFELGTIAASHYIQSWATHILPARVYISTIPKRKFDRRNFVMLNYQQSHHVVVCLFFAVSDVDAFIDSLINTIDFFDGVEEAPAEGKDDFVPFI